MTGERSVIERLQALFVLLVLAAGLTAGAYTVGQPTLAIAMALAGVVVVFLAIREYVYTFFAVMYNYPRTTER